MSLLFRKASDSSPNAEVLPPRLRCPSAGIAAARRRPSCLSRPLQLPVVHTIRVMWADQTGFMLGPDAVHRPEGHGDRGAASDSGGEMCCGCRGAVWPGP